METYIKDLKLSQGTKIFLTWYMKITKVSELEGLNYLTFANKCPKNCNALAMADELNALGYLYPPENEIFVNDIPMLKRLQNVLMRNNILYLSQLSIHSREEILGFRNMGKGTMTELDNICKEHGIQIHSLSPIKQSFIEYHFSNELLEMFMRHNIFCVDDFKQKSAKDLYDVCGENYTLTMQTYYTLKRKGIILDDWQDKYIFEVIAKNKADRIWRHYQISTVSQLLNCNKKQLKGIKSESPELLETIK